MKKYTIKVRLDAEHDAWNWYDVSRCPVFEGYRWRDNIHGEFREEFDKLVKLNDKEAKTEAKHFVKKLLRERADEFASLEWWINTEVQEKFDEACAWLEKTTGRELAAQHFTIWLTTFSRAPYFPDKNELFFCIYWVNPIENFLHEGLHFQCHKYWRDNPKSPVSKLTDAEWEFLKESLTVVIDDDARPLVRRIDKGYPEHAEFREALHKGWTRHHDFDELINHGLQILSQYFHR